MISYRVEETIQRLAVEVFPYFADPMLHTRWMDVSDVRVSTPGNVRVGTSVDGMMKFGSRIVPFSWEVISFQAGASLAFRTTDGPFSWEGKFEVVPGDDATTRIIGSGSLRLKGWRRIMEPFMGGEVQRGEAAEFRRLKELLEGPT